ncbi:MAG: glutamine amidotransferase [Bacillota bacterium]
MAIINLYHLYPEHLNLYGDRGNVLALVQRALWHGIQVNLVPVQPGEKIDFTACDLLFMGGGQDYEQKLVAGDLKGRREEMLQAVEAGAVILAICGSYQLLGQYYATFQGERIPGLEILDLYTEAGRKRMIGNIVTRCNLWDPPRTLVGFENHAGRTFLGPSVQPLGQVVNGFGNNGTDKTEGVVYRNVIGTYLHGSLLPKNPWLTDYLLEKALAYRNQPFTFRELDETLERQAHEIAVQLAGSRMHKLRSTRA